MATVYQKRSGTSGISGHLYETKLIAIILFRLFHHDSIEDFCLASNMDEIGAFDDVCFKIKIKEHDRPVAIFIQAKHKDNNDKYPTFDNKNESVKWFESLSKIKKKITASKNQDLFFSLDIAEADYIFILYTNARCDFDSKKAYISKYDAILNKLLVTSSTVGSLPLYTEQHVEAFGEIILKEEITLLVEHFAKFLDHKATRSMNIMNDEYILQYHVLLNQEVVEVSEIQTDVQKSDVKYRNMIFRPNFFESEDRHTILIRDQLFKEILKNQPKIRMKGRIDEKKSQDLYIPETSDDVLISSFLLNPSVATLTPLIITHIAINENGKLEFVLKRPSNDIEQMRGINISRCTVDEAICAANAAARRFLQSLKFRVPIAFGNVDLAISGNTKKIDRRLNYLKTSIVELCKLYEQRESYRIVGIDDTIDGGILSSNGGLASSVGNLLSYDKQTKMLQFSKDYAPEQNNAKALFIKLSNEIDNLHEYRFNIKTMKFPKVHFDCTDIAREFLSKLVIFAKQRSHSEVEEVLKEDIHKHLCTGSKKYLITPDSVFLHYHNEIQKWWMSPKKGMYLTKANNLYRQAVNNIMTEPQISTLQIMFDMSHSKYFGYSFNEDATKWMELPALPSNVLVVTDTVLLTTVKVINWLKSHDSKNIYVLLDLQFVLNLSTTEFCSLQMELTKTEKVIVFVCNKIINNSVSQIRLYELVQAMKHKQIYFITNKVLMKLINEFFTTTNILHDQTQSLTALTLESQREVMKNAKIKFQGKNISLDSFVDDASVAFIKGDVLDKIISNEILSIGTSITAPNYEEIKHFYIDRRVIEVKETANATQTNGHVIKTFHDIDADAVLITSAPGMGKSTLLTHLSIQTKECDSRLWIVRVNLLEYAKHFYKWQTAKISLDVLEMLKFLCHVLTKNNNTSIYLENNKVYLKSFDDDELAHFELNMFLHSYNMRKLLIIFDGFDEICPHYKDTVINFLHVVRDHPQKNKMWVTSRPYSDILADLKKVFGTCFKIEHLSITEQESYLERTWSEKLILEKLNDVQSRNLKFFVNDISQTISVGIYHMDDVHVWFRRVFLHFYKFVHSHIGLFGFSQEAFEIAKKYCSATENVDTLAGTPLLLYFIAEYIVNVIDDHEPRFEGQLYVNALKIYETFVENKLKKVLYQDKNKMDLYNPDIIMKFKKELVDCVSMHTRIAAYALLNKTVYGGSNAGEFEDMNPINWGPPGELSTFLSRVKRGEDKTGLISHVTVDDVPVFIHRTFTEYFAAEYICDVLKNEKFDFEKKKKWLNAVSECCSEDVFVWVRFKSKLDKVLTDIIRAMEITESFTLFLI